MDWTKVYSIEKMANELEHTSNRSGFISGAKIVVEYLNDIIKSSHDSADIGDKVCLLVKKLEEENDYDY